MQLANQVEQKKQQIKYEQWQILHCHLLEIRLLE